MKMKCCFVSALLLSLPALSQAADVGATVVPKDHFNKAHAELVYEFMNREMEGNTTLEGNALYARLHTAVGQTATLDFDLGGLDLDNADTAFYGGLGLRFMVYDAPSWRIGAHLQAHYSPGIEAEASEAEKLDYDLFEVDGGITLNGRFQLAEDLTLIPYIGPVFSVLSLDGDRADADSENPAGAVVGLALQLPEGNTLRAEARIFDEVSFSASAGIAF